MANYTKTTDFAAKDALSSGDPEKVATGTDVDVEFNAISTAIATKEDSANKNVANGYAGLDSSALLPDARLSSNIPRLNATNTFTSTLNVFSGASCLLELNETDAAADNRRWGLNVNGETFYANVLNDARSAEANWLVVNRTANNIDSIAFTTDVITWNTLNIGFREIPQNSQSGNYTLGAQDNGKHIYHASGAGAGDTYTIPANASVAYPIGAVLTFVNGDSNSVSIAITTDTMTLAGTTTTGTRTLAQNGVATALKTTATTWIISGTGLT
jgi:hypothetical protein